MTKVLPIAFRCLQDGLFRKPIKKWCEVYFINRAGHVGVFMFHGFSVQNLSEAARDLYYEKGELCEVIWTVYLERKINKQGKAYYMAFFDFEPLDDAALQQHQKCMEDMESTYFHIYRADTMDAKTLFADHYSTNLEPIRAEIEVEKITRAKLLKEFSQHTDQKAA